jgi:peptidoglycan/xylan/chitin deacetylase (PgdA/CDA1 family)
MTGADSAILMYRSLDDSGSAVSTPPALFRAQMLLLAGSGIPVVHPDEAVRTPGTVALTFDDGFRNFFEYALPILLELDMTATVFVATDHSGGRSHSLPLMDWTEVRETARAGIAIGSHGRGHRSLEGLDAVLLNSEIRDSKMALEDHIGMPVEGFAYPYGRCPHEARVFVQEWYSYACGTELGYASSADDLFNLPRLDARYWKTRFHQLMSQEGHSYIAVRRVLQRMKRFYASDR